MQALTLLNDSQFHELALQIAREMTRTPGTESERISVGFLRCTGRRPDPAESARLLRLLHEEQQASGPGSPPEAGWLAVARVLLNLDETITRE